jgi:hypothetical protein
LPRRRLFSLLAALGVGLLAPRPARALPVAYVGTTADPLVAHTGVVVMMREGTRTILSMESNYDGPLEPFALVVPLPAEIRPSDARTIPRALFERVTMLGAPRLVESWEDDPCAGQSKGDGGARRRGSHGSSAKATAAAPPRTAKVHEAPPAAPEYDVTALTEADSANVVAWLRAKGYVVPPALEEALRTYASRGAHFVVARFDPVRTPLAREGPKRTARDSDGAGKLAMLPPLRFAFDSDRFELPLALGRAISAGTQDLVLYVLARHQRYEAAEWEDLLAPTGLEMTAAAAPAFPSVYRSIFDTLVAGRARAAVTEYVHDAVACDPCAAPPLDPADLLMLGADVLPAAPGERESPTFGNGFVLTRMQLRYRKDDAADLSLRAVPPLSAPAAGAVPHDDFQALYTVHHAWEGPMPCDAPSRGAYSSRGAKPIAAARLAFGSPEDVDLASVIADDVPSLDVVHPKPVATESPAVPPAAPPPPPGPAATVKSAGCGCAAAGERSGAGASLVACALAFASRRRKRRP